MAQQSDGAIGHRKHHQAFGDKRKMKSPRFRLWQKMSAERTLDRKARRTDMVDSVAKLFDKLRGKQHGK